MLVHCLGGSGRTAQALLLAASIAEIDIGQIGGTSESNKNRKLIPDLVFLASQACKQRKGILKEREHLRQCYQAVLLHCGQILQQHGLVEPEKRIASPSLSALRQQGQQQHDQQPSGGLDSIVAPIQVSE